MIIHLWNDGDPGPEPAQPQLGDVDAVDRDGAARGLDNPDQFQASASAH